MEVFLDNRQSKITIKEDITDFLNLVVEKSLEVLDMEYDYEVSVSFVDNEEIRELNRDYRGIDRQTDVLSFPMDDDILVPVPLLGDIIISVEKALEQSKDYGHSLERELAYLTAHSMLHLCGYDHMEEEEKKTMRDKEKEIMKRIGVFKNTKGNTGI